MHEHDTDLIMALAEGTLDPASAAAAEAEVAACPECADDLTMQRTALLVLTAAPRATMNDIERARIRRAVRSELGLPSPAAATADRGGSARRFRLFAGLAGAAAVLIAFVLIAPGLDLSRIGGGDDADSTVADLDIAFGADTATAASETTIAATSPEMAATDRAEITDGGGRELNEQGSGEELETTTTAAPSTIPASVSPTSYTFYGSEQLQELPDLTALADAIESDKSLAAFGPPGVDQSARLSDLDEQACLVEGLAMAPETTEAYILAIAGVNDVEVVIVAYVEGDFDDVVVVAHDLETCRIVPVP